MRSIFVSEILYFVHISRWLPFPAKYSFTAESFVAWEYFLFLLLIRSLSIPSALAFPYIVLRRCFADPILFCNTYIAAFAFHIFFHGIYSLLFCMLRFS